MSLRFRYFLGFLVFVAAVAVVGFVGNSVARLVYGLEERNVLLKQQNMLLAAIERGNPWIIETSDNNPTRCFYPFRPYSFEEGEPFEWVTIIADVVYPGWRFRCARRTRGDYLIPILGSQLFDEKGCYIGSEPFSTVIRGYTVRLLTYALGGAKAGDPPIILFCELQEYR